MRRNLCPFIPSQMRALLAVAAFIAAVLFSGTASAQFCPPQPLAGHWVNVNPNTPGITRANIAVTCFPFPLPQWSVHLWGRCHPTDCDWGTVPAFATPPGPLPAAMLTAMYDQGFAKRLVRIQPIAANRIRLRVDTDFVDPKRKDYSATYILRRVP